jgi:hypothetical protein
MTGLNRVFPIAVLAMAMAAPPGNAADIDRAAVDFTPPSEIKWVRNAAGTNEQANANKVHYDGAKDEEAVIQVWGMGPATSTQAWKK